MGGVVLYFVTSVACALAPSIELLIAARFLQAIGACAAPVLARAIVRDVHGPTESARILSYISTAMALAPLVGPMLGSYLTVWFGWRANFVVLAAFAGLSFLAVWTLLVETNLHKDADAFHPARMAGNMAALLRNRAYLGYVLTAAFAYSGLFAFLSGASFVLIEVLRIPTEHFGLYFAVVVLGYMIGTQIGARLVMRHGIDRMIYLGTLLGLAAGLAMTLLSWCGVAHVAAIIAPQFFCLVALGMILPNSIAGAIGPFPQMAGLASSLLGFIQMSMAALVGVGVGHFHDGTATPMTMVIAAMACLASIAFGLLVRRARPRLA